MKIFWNSGAVSRKEVIMEFNYLYGKQAEQFNFVNIPKALIKEEAFSNVSLEAKMLYGLILERMGMYKKNNWQDEAGRVYVVYPVKEIMDDMNRSENSVTKYLNELEDADLIETVQRGQGRTNIIYVKNFELVEEEAAEVRSSNIESLEVQKSDF